MRPRVARRSPPPSSSYRPFREMSVFTLHPGRARRAVNGLPAPRNRVARFPSVTSRLLRPAQFPRADKPRKETANCSVQRDNAMQRRTHGSWRPHPPCSTALIAAQSAIEEATDIMHYEDGLPVTALEGWEIERAYLALCGVLVELDSAIAACGRTDAMTAYTHITNHQYCTAASFLSSFT
jgi:hypothetical protein